LIAVKSKAGEPGEFSFEMADLVPYGTITSMNLFGNDQCPASLFPFMYPIEIMISQKDDKPYLKILQV